MGLLHMLRYVGFYRLNWVYMLQVLEFLPLVIFFACYKLVDIYIATGALIACMAINTLIFSIKAKQLDKKQGTFFLIALVLGGMTILFRDDSFIKWKVTVINLVFAAVLLISDLGFKKNFIKSAMQSAIHAPDAVWRKVNLAWVGFFTFIAAINIYIAYQMPLDFWVNFKVFGLMGLSLAFLIATLISLRKYIQMED